MTASPGGTGPDLGDTAGGERQGPGGSPRPGSQARPGSEARRGGQARPGGSSRPGEPPRLPGADLAAGLQRWLIRSSARSMRRELTGQFRKTFGSAGGDAGDVWNTATTEPPPGESGEAPECAWCPVCRAARRIRESGPGLGGQLSGAGDAVAAAVHEALSAFDAVLSMHPRTDPADSRPRTDPADSRSYRPGPAATGGAGVAPGGTAAATRPKSPATGTPSGGPDREPDDRG